MSRKQQTIEDNPGCLALFGLPFAAVGIGMAAWLIWDLVQFNRMRDWAETPATIVSTELDVSRDSEGSTTYQVKAVYSWQWEGREYRGERVSLDVGSDNIGKFHKNTHKTLRQHVKTEEPFPCYVNPAQPEQAILFRNLRLAMVGFRLAFALSFGPVGLFILFAALGGGKKKRKRKKTEVDHPDQPWRWNEEWASGVIRSEKRKEVILVFFFAIIWNAVSSPVVFLIPGEVRDGAPWFLYAFFLFPVIGIGLAVTWIYKTLQWLKYGESRFEMNPVPGVIGGKLAGTVYTNRNLDSATGYVVGLSCERAARGKNDSTATLHEDSYTLSRETLEHDSTRSAIPILFAIPYNEQESGGRITWKVTVKAETAGIDFSDYFEVPVFKTPHSDPDYRLNPAPLQPYLKHDSEM